MPGVKQTGGPKLRQLADAVAGIADANFRQDLDQGLITAGKAALREEFDEGRNPYGEEWQPLKHGDRQPFSKSKRFRNTFEFRPSMSGGFAVSARGAMPLAHQQGATIPARHSEGREMFFHPRTGEALRKGRVKRFKLVYVTRQRAHDIGSFDLPERMLLPTSERGGAGALWADRFRLAASRVMRAQLAKGK